MSKRKLIVDGHEYEYRVGRSHVVIRRDGKKVAAPGFHEVTGEKWHVIEHDQHKENFHITPSQVEDYIRGL